MAPSQSFRVVEATIADIHAAYRAGTLTARQLVQMYLDRIAAYDKKGPTINAVISLNPEGSRRSRPARRAFKASGFVGPLHGIPVIMKDQADVNGMPTTLGSVLFKDYMPDRDCFVAAKLKKAGVIFIGKATLGELGGGDTHGSLFGSTRNVYDLERTAGGSSGGSGASVSANFCTVGDRSGRLRVDPAAVDLERRRRHAADDRARQPRRRLRRLADDQRLARADGPHRHRPREAARRHGGLRPERSGHRVTASGRTADELLGRRCDKAALKGARIGILRESMGYRREPDSDDFTQDRRGVRQGGRRSRKAGAEIVDPIVIPDLKALLATRVPGSVEDDDRMFELFFEDGKRAVRDARRGHGLAAVPEGHRSSANAALDRCRPSGEQHHAYLQARDTLMINMLKVMADHRLDAIVHKAVEHQPTLIKDGVNPPYVDQKGAPHINTFLMFVPSIVVPAGFTRDNLPAGITFLGRPYDDASMIQLAYAYEQATRHRRAPSITP